MRPWKLALASTLVLVACHAPRPGASSDTAPPAAQSTTELVAGAQPRVATPVGEAQDAPQLAPTVDDDLERALAFALNDDRTIELLSVLCDEHAPRLTQQAAQFVRKPSPRFSPYATVQCETRT